MQGTADRIIRFGSFTLDPGLARLRRGADPVHLRAKTYALLSHLVKSPGRVVPKDELMEVLWPDVTVTDESLTQTIRDLRRALGDEAEHLLRTVPRRGYIFETGAAASATAADAMPVVVVLPFALRSGTEEDQHLLDGIVEEVTHGLGRYGQVRVVARHSAFRFRPEDTPPETAAARLGAAYFVEGVAHRTLDGLRVVTSLCEAVTGRQLWSESFEIGPQGFAEVQRLIPHRVVTRLTLDLERRLDTSGGTEALDAYRHFIAAVRLLRQFGPGVNEGSRDHLDAAIAIDPDFALAHIYRGLVEIALGGYSTAAPAALDAAMVHVSKGLGLAPEEARGHWVAGSAQLYRREHAAAELHMRKALALNPCDADSLAMLGRVLCARGQTDEGLASFRQAMRLNPLHPLWYHNAFAIVLHSAGRYDEAIGHLNAVTARTAFRETRLAICHAMLGHAAETARHLDEAERLEPGWDVMAEVRRTSGFEHPADHDRLVAEAEATVALRDSWAAGRSR